MGPPQAEGKAPSGSEPISPLSKGSQPVRVRSRAPVSVGSSNNQDTSPAWSRGDHGANPCPPAIAG
jgi:hypothetical protein